MARKGLWLVLTHNIPVKRSNKVLEHIGRHRSSSLPITYTYLKLKRAMEIREMVASETEIRKGEEKERELKIKYRHIQKKKEKKITMHKKTTT